MHPDPAPPAFFRSRRSFGSVRFFLFRSAHPLRKDASGGRSFPPGAAFFYAARGVARPAEQRLIGSKLPYAPRKLAPLSPGKTRQRRPDSKHHTARQRPREHGSRRVPPPAAVRGTAAGTEDEPGGERRLRTLTAQFMSMVGSCPTKDSGKIRILALISAIPAGVQRLVGDEFVPFCRGGCTEKSALVQVIEFGAAEFAYISGHGLPPSWRQRALKERHAS